MTPANIRRFPHRQACLAAMLSCALVSCALPAMAQLDLDGDGYTDADGDLYDVPGGLVTSPELVNPGAYDIVGNGIDDDCDGTIDNPTVDCSAGAQLTGLSGGVMAQALDLCQATTESPPFLSQRRWGLINAQLRRSPVNAAAPHEYQTAVGTQFGANLFPRMSTTMGVLSTGTARDAGQPNFIAPLPGFSDNTNQATAPADFLAAHGNFLYNRDGCPTLPGGNPVNDMVLLRLRIRVPTNATHLRFEHAFLTAQFPDVCNQFSDHFVALMYGIADGLPADHNVAYDPLGHPITVQTAYFPSCTPVAGQACPDGPALLAGTGFLPGSAACTGWNTSAAPVVGGRRSTSISTCSTWAITSSTRRCCWTT